MWKGEWEPCKVVWGTVKVLESIKKNCSQSTNYFMKSDKFKLVKDLGLFLLYNQPIWYLYCNYVLHCFLNVCVLVSMGQTCYTFPIGRMTVSGMCHVWKTVGMFGETCTCTTTKIKYSIRNGPVDLSNALLIPQAPITASKVTAKHAGIYCCTPFYVNLSICFFLSRHQCVHELFHVFVTAVWLVCWFAETY